MNAKQIIEDGAVTQPPQDGPPARRPRRMGQMGSDGGFPPEGFEGGQTGMLTHKERSTLKDLIMLDMLSALNFSSFYEDIVKTATEGKDPTPGQIQHFLDEAGKFADKMSPEVNALMGKLSNLPR